MYAKQLGCATRHRLTPILQYEKYTYITVPAGSAPPTPGVSDASASVGAVKKEVPKGQEHKKPIANHAASVEAKKEGEDLVLNDLDGQDPVG